MKANFNETRRNFLKGAAAAGAAGLTLGHPLRSLAAAATNSRIMITGEALIEHDLRHFSYSGYSAVCDFLRNGDAGVTNLGVAIAEPGIGKPTRHGKFFHAADPAVLTCLKDMGINMLALAENHAWDMGTESLLATRKLAQRAGFAVSGTGADNLKAASAGHRRTPKGDISLVSIATGKLNPQAIATAKQAGVNTLAVDKGFFDREDAHRNIRAIQNAADAKGIVIVSHSNRRPSDDLANIPAWQRQWAHDCIDAGASMYVSYGTPMLQGIEIYKGCPIFYGLGNFIFHTRTNPEYYPSNAWESVIADCRFEGRKCREIRLKPITLNEWGEEGSLYMATRGRPTLAEGDDNALILDRLARFSAALGTGIELDDEEGAILIR